MFDNYILILFFIAILVIWVPWLLAHKIRPYFGRKALRQWLEARKHKHIVIDALNSVEELYAHTNAFKISKDYRDKSNLHTDQFLYGEIYLVTLIKLLDIAKPRAGEIFYDFGSGSGKTVLLADKVYHFGACKGIELLPSLYELSASKAQVYAEFESAKKKPKPTNVQFIQADFLEYDFSDANIIFINATAYKGEIFDKLVPKLKLLKSGTRIIITTLQLEDEAFDKIYQAHEVMSWGFCSVRIYQKK